MLSLPRWLFSMCQGLSCPGNWSNWVIVHTLCWAYTHTCTYARTHTHTHAGMHARSQLQHYCVVTPGNRQTMAGKCHEAASANTLKVECFQLRCGNSVGSLIRCGLTHKVNRIKEVHDNFCYPDISKNNTLVAALIKSLIVSLPFSVISNKKYSKYTWICMCEHEKIN